MATPQPYPTVSNVKSIIAKLFQSGINRSLDRMDKSTRDLTCPRAEWLQLDKTAVVYTLLKKKLQAGHSAFIFVTTTDTKPCYWFGRELMELVGNREWTFHHEKNNWTAFLNGLSEKQQSSGEGDVVAAESIMKQQNVKETG